MECLEELNNIVEEDMDDVDRRIRAAHIMRKDAMTKDTKAYWTDEKGLRENKHIAKLDRLAIYDRNYEPLVL